MLKKNYLWVAFSTLYRYNWMITLRYHAMLWIDSINAMLMIAVFAVIGTTHSDIYQTNQLYVIGLGLLAMVLMTRAYFSTAHGLMYYKLERVLENYVMSPLPGWLWLSTVMLEETQNAFLATLPYMLLLLVLGLPMPTLTGFLLALSLILLIMMFFIPLGFMMMLPAQKWNDLSKWDNTIIYPALMLSGTFFDATALPEQYRFLMEYNPLYMLQHGLRELWFLHKVPPLHTYVTLGTMAFLSFTITMLMLNRGYGLKK